MSVYEGLSESKQFACRVIADHARATAFAIADGILPGNEGRNYVLRKIMRRAIYHGREHLGLKDLFFHKVCDLVVERMGTAFPELNIQRDFIGKMVRLEEERFGNTLGVGLQRFIDDYKDISQGKILDLFVEAIFASSDGERAKLNSLIASIQEDQKEAMKGGNLRYFIQKMIEHRIPPFIFGEMLRFHLKGEVWGRPNGPIENVIFEEVKTSERAFEKELINELETRFTYPQIVTELIKRLDELYDGTEKLNFKTLAKYYDTYGLPADLIRIKLEEAGIVFEDEEFNERFEGAVQAIQKQSGIGQTQRKSEINPMYAQIAEAVGVNKFHGYDATRLEEAQVASLVKGDERVDSLNEGDEGLIILGETPFYAESGGQVGDNGVLYNADVQIRVMDTFAPVPGVILHKSRIEKGSVSVGDRVSAVVDEQRRDATRRNHTATHLVHAALKEVLGSHVKQAGSVVAPNYLRFDFTHYQPMAAAEIKEVEDLVNRHILENHPVATNMMALEEAMRSGAVAMFGEKYGSEVRVLSVGDGKFSMELCGGTHVRATGDIGSFKITSDEAIASGVRRIRAITGLDAFERFREDEALIDRSLDVLKTQRDQLPNAIERLQDELKRTRREIDDLKLKIATGAIGGASSNGDEAREVSGVKVVGKIVDGLDANGMRQLSDTLLARLKSGVVVLGRREEGKAGIIVRVSDDLKDKIRAGNVIKEIVPLIGGKGGGRPDMAEGGGPEADKLPDAMEASYKVIETFLGG